STTESSSMLSGSNGGGAVFFSNECAQRKPRRNRLGDSDDIRHHCETLEGEHRPGAAEPALDLIKDQGSLVAIRQSAAFAQKFDRAFVNSAFPENGFQHDGAGIVIHRRAQALQVILLHERDYLEQGLEPFALFIL